MWDLDWNDLTNEERAHLARQAEFTTCPHCGDPGQTAMELFMATLKIIHARDRRALESTMNKVAGA